MPTFKRGDVSIYYEEYGSGYPILLFAPGGMRSSIEFWANSPFDPTKELADQLPRDRDGPAQRRQVGGADQPPAMDGKLTLAIISRCSIISGSSRCHLMGGCIGGSYCLGVIKAAPERVSAAVLQNPIGLSPRNREMFYKMFDTWADGAEAEASES